eukprot:RCo015356
MLVFLLSLLSLCAPVPSVVAAIHSAGELTCSGSGELSPVHCSPSTSPPLHHTDIRLDDHPPTSSVWYELSAVLAMSCACPVGTNQLKIGVAHSLHWPPSVKLPAA